MVVAAATKATNGTSTRPATLTPMAPIARALPAGIGRRKRNRNNHGSNERAEDCNEAGRNRGQEQAKHAQHPAL